jgi:replicative superfamily II helicase
MISKIIADIRNLLGPLTNLAHMVDETKDMDSYGKLLYQEAERARKATPEVKKLLQDILDLQDKNNDAVEFAEWVSNVDWYYIKERDYWVTGNGIDELESKQFHPRITRTSQELYQLYLSSKRK